MGDRALNGRLTQPQLAPGTIVKAYCAYGSSRQRAILCFLITVPQPNSVVSPALQGGQLQFRPDRSSVMHGIFQIIANVFFSAIDRALNGRLAQPQLAPGVKAYCAY